MVERLTLDQEVLGSSPSPAAIFLARFEREQSPGTVRALSFHTFCTHSLWGPGLCTPQEGLGHTVSILGIDCFRLLIHHLADDICGVLLHMRQNVRVDVLGNPGVRVPQPFGDHLHRHSGRDKSCGLCVS